MGIGINIGDLTGSYATKSNYSTLLQSLPSRSGISGTADLNFFSDYASIKNGSYGKLMRAYYGGNTNNNIKSIVNNSSFSTSNDTTTQLKQIETAAETLKSSADKLLATGSKSLFGGEENVDEIYKAVSTFVNDYNSMLDKAGELNSASITSRITSLKNMTSSNKNLLERVGITVGTDGILSIDQEIFKKADMTTVKSLFNGTGSYAWNISSQASWINFTAANEATKANTYNANGNFNNSTGNIFSTYF
jgi:hypothetical protein